MYALPESFWYGITWFGDSGLLLPIAAWICVWLWTRPSTRALAWMWLLLFCTAGALVGLTKIAFMGWGLGIRSINFTGISGHTMLSTSVWPVACWLVASRAGHRARVAAAAFGLMLAVAIGLSRLAIYAHSKSEVASGFLLGLAVSGLFLWLQHPRPHPRLHWSLVVLSLMTPLIALRPGDKAPTHDLIGEFAIRLSGAERPYTRDDLLKGRAVPSIDRRGSIAS